MSNGWLITTNQWAGSNNKFSVSSVLLGLNLFFLALWLSNGSELEQAVYSVFDPEWLFSWTPEKRFKSRIWNWILVFTLLFLLHYAASDINSPVFVRQLIGWTGPWLRWLTGSPSSHLSISDRTIITVSVWPSTSEETSFNIILCLENENIRYQTVITRSFKFYLLIFGSNIEMYNLQL